MKKSGFSIKRTKNGTKMSYYGDLQEAIKKAKKELKNKYQDEQKTKFLKWNYERAKKEYEAWVNRINGLERFIELAEEKLKEEVTP